MLEAECPRCHHAGRCEVTDDGGDSGIVTVMCGGCRAPFAVDIAT